MRIISGLIITSMIWTGCSKDETEEPEVNQGTLKFRTSVWNSENPSGWKSTEGIKDVKACDLIDIFHLIPKIEITTDEISEGVSPGSIKWTTIYESSEVMLHTDRMFSLAVPIGKYKGFRITQRNLIYWVCTWDTDTLHFPSYQISEAVSPDELFVNYFGQDGLYEIDPESGLFYLFTGNEKLGSFDVKPAKTTRLTVRLNITGLDWHDMDGDGKWSDGDDLDNWRTPEGISTMSDFIVEYD